MNVAQNKNALFREGKELYPGPSFNPDAILDQGLWTEAKTRKRAVLFLLKETHDLQGDLCTKLCPEIELPLRMWKPVGLWAYALQNTRAESKPTLMAALREQDDWKKALWSSAIANLKKVSGKRTSNLTDLRKWALEDHDGRNRALLKRQLAEIQPNIVVCGGVGVLRLAKDVFELEESDTLTRGWLRISGITWIDFYHPRFIGYEFSFSKISAIFRDSLTRGR